MPLTQGVSVYAVTEEGTLMKKTGKHHFEEDIMRNQSPGFST